MEALRGCDSGRPGTDEKYPISESNDIGTEPILTGYVSSVPRKSAAPKLVELLRTVQN